MRALDELLENNRKWAESIKAKDRSFFDRLAQGQRPRYLWIGCADSRVPANEIVGLPPGALFVHRNVANLVVPTDFNALSVVQYAVDVLKVEHIIVCGHYGCGGIEAAIARDTRGLVSHWLEHVRHVQERHEARLANLRGRTELVNRMCELNVIEQTHALSESHIVQDAWSRGQSLSLHGWIYAIADGLIRDLHVTITRRDEADAAYAKAIETVFSRQEDK